MLLGNIQQLVAQALSEHGKRIKVIICVDHMISGDQLLTDTKLICRLTKAAGVSDKNMTGELTAKDVSNVMYVRVWQSELHLLVGCSQVESENIVFLQDCYC